MIERSDETHEQVEQQRDDDEARDHAESALDLVR